MKIDPENKRLKDQLTHLNAYIEQTAILQQEKDLLEKEYQLSQNRFRTVFEESAVGNKLIDDQLRIVKVNDALLKILGYTENEVLGRKILDFSHPDFVEHWKKLQLDLWTKEMSSFNFEACLIKKSGETAWVQVTSILIEDNGKILGYTILKDISERKELERLRASIREREQRQLIVDSIVHTQEERGRIAESLHNGLGQVLFAVKLSLAHVLVKCDGNEPGNEEALQYTEQLLSACIDECTRISHALTPAMLEQYGLKVAISDICYQLIDRIPIAFSCQGLSPRIERFLEVGIYRIIQELTQNIVKHAQATLASINVSESEMTIQISVKDNGKGFDEAMLKGNGTGLQMIRHEVTLLSGTIKITSAKGEGTLIDIDIPKH